MFILQLMVSLQDPLMDFSQLSPVSLHHSTPSEPGLVFQVPVKGMLPFLVQHLQIHTVAEQQNSLSGPWLCFGCSQRLLDLPPGQLSGRLGKNRAGGFVLHVQSVLLWGFNNLLLFLSLLGVAQQQLQVRVRAGPFVWLQCFVTCMHTAHLVTNLLDSHQPWCCRGAGTRHSS